MSTILSCHNEVKSSVAEKLPAQTLLNVLYGADSAQRMDIYLPEGRTVDSTEVIVLIHGGGWNGGSKSDFASYITTLKQRLPHYAIFNSNYRLASAAHLFPTQEKDVQTAIQFIASKAGEYTVDKNKVALLGASAGAHLALLQAYKYDSPIKIKAVIDFFGPTDLLAMYHHPWHSMIPYLLQMITGTTPDANVEFYKQSSPVYFVTSQSAPTLILHGGNDYVVNLSQSKALKNKLDSVGVVNQMVIYPKAGHGWTGATLADSFDKIETFLKANVR